MSKVNPGQTDKPVKTPEQELVRLRKVVKAAEECVLLGDTSIIEEGDQEDCALLHDIAELHQENEQNKEDLYEANCKIEDLAEYIRALRWDTEVNGCVGTWLFKLPSHGKDEFVATQHEARASLIRAQTKAVFVDVIPDRAHRIAAKSCKGER